MSKPVSIGHAASIADECFLGQRRKQTIFVYSQPENGGNATLTKWFIAGARVGAKVMKIRFSQRRSIFEAQRLQSFQDDPQVATRESVVLKHDLLHWVKAIRWRI